MKKGLLILITVILSFVLVEIVSGYLLWIRKTGISSTTLYGVKGIYNQWFSQQGSLVVSYYPKSMSIPDEYLGYCDSPGAYSVRIQRKTSGEYYSFTIMSVCTIFDGERIANSDGEGAGVFGCVIE